MRTDEGSKSTNDERRVCPICSNSHTELLHVQEFADHCAHHIASCKHCGFTYVENTPAQDYYDRYYQQESKYEGVRQHEAHETATQNELLGFLKKHLPKTASILDVGCSTGSLLAYIKNKGYTCLEGLDPAPKCRTIAKQKYGIKVTTAGLSSFKPKKKYDLVILSQVLEHLIDVKSAINLISALLNDGGYVFIGVPDAGKFYLDFDEPFGEFSIEHINFFTESSFSALMHNFESIKINSVENRILFGVWQKSIPAKTSLLEYIKQSKAKLQKTQKIIDKLPSSVIVWGAGALTRRLLLTTNLKKKVKFFVDGNSNLIGSQLEGIDIRQPEILSEHSLPVLISSFNFRDEIVDEIKKKKLRNKIYTL
jgi:2-polyprenyl-3-methyl-5-hydroxy-6-metoxy-1,4-benzoquinol methylase